MGVAHQLATIGGIALARAIGLKIFSFHFVCLLKARVNLYGIERLCGIMNENAWIINYRSSKTFNLVCTDI